MVNDHQEVQNHKIDANDNGIPLLAKLVYGQYSDEKAKKILDHEKGIGSPCTKCQSCEGLDLHYWRKSCKTCGCKYDEHRIEHENNKDHALIVYNLLRDNDSDSLSSLDYSSDDEMLENHPYVREFTTMKEKPMYPKIKSEVLQPYECVVDEQKEKQTFYRRRRTKSCRPRKSKGSSPGDENNNNNCFSPNELSEKYIDKSITANVRKQQLAYQFPPHDFDKRKSNDLDEYELREQALFLQLVQTQAIGKGIHQLVGPKEDWVCFECSEHILSGQLIIAERFPSKTWHPGCFKCSSCKEKLADGIYFYGNERVYCGRHYGETVKERCYGCDELIFSERFTKADEKSWHQKHFCCFKCDKQLGGNDYVTYKEEPCCFSCYHCYFAERCLSCGLPINVGAESLEHDMVAWHDDAACFCCYRCNRSLQKLKFVFKEDQLFCSTECSDQY